MNILFLGKFRQNSIIVFTFGLTFLFGSNNCIAIFSLFKQTGSVIFFVAKIHHFAILKKSPKQHGQGNFLENFPKKSPRKKVMKLPRFFLEASVRFLAFFFLNRHIQLIGQSGNRNPRFVLLFYLTSSQIWLNPDCHFWRNMRKLKKEKTLDRFQDLVSKLLLNPSWDGHQPTNAMPDNWK